MSNFQSNTSPPSADTTDPPMIASFAVSDRKPEVNERDEIKIDIVNPIPATIPVPIIWDQLIPESIPLIFDFTRRNVKRTIPKGLPINNPSMMPSDIGEARFEPRSSDNGIAVFARAKIGRMK